MNSMEMSLAADRRSGLKSRASMEVDTSTARTMSMPSVSTRSISLLERGRAMQMMIKARAARRKASGRCRMMPRMDFPPFSHGVTVDTRRCGRRSFSSRYRYSARSRTGRTSSQSRYGYSKNMAYLGI